MGFDFEGMFKTLFWLAGVGVAAIIGVAVFCLYKLSIFLFF